MVIVNSDGPYNDMLMNEYHFSLTETCDENFPRIPKVEALSNIVATWWQYLQKAEICSLTCIPVYMDKKI